MTPGIIIGRCLQRPAPTQGQRHPCRSGLCLSAPKLERRLGNFVASLRKPGTASKDKDHLQTCTYIDNINPDQCASGILLARQLLPNTTPPADRSTPPDLDDAIPIPPHRATSPSAATRSESPALICLSRKWSHFATSPSSAEVEPGSGSLATDESPLTPASTENRSSCPSQRSPQPAHHAIAPPFPSTRTL